MTPEHIALVHCVFADVLRMADTAAAPSSLDNADYLSFLSDPPLPARNRLIDLLNI